MYFFGNLRAGRRVMLQIMSGPKLLVAGKKKNVGSKSQCEVTGLQHAAISGKDLTLEVLNEHS